MLLSSSAMSMGGIQLFGLLFERIPEYTAIITTDHDGIIQSATSNIFVILRVPARELCGKSLRDALGTSVDPNFLSSSVKGQVGKHITGEVMELVAQTEEGPVLVQLQVIDAQHNMFVVTIKLSTSSFPGGGKAVGEKQPEEEEEIGYYTVKGKLGTGQCGVVKKAVHRTTGVEVSVLCRNGVFPLFRLIMSGRLRSKHCRVQSLKKLVSSGMTKSWSSCAT